MIIFLGILTVILMLLSIGEKDKDNKHTYMIGFAASLAVTLLAKLLQMVC